MPFSCVLFSGKGILKYMAAAFQRNTSCPPRGLCEVTLFLIATVPPCLCVFPTVLLSLSPVRHAPPLCASLTFYFFPVHATLLLLLSFFPPSNAWPKKQVIKNKDTSALLYWPFHCPLCTQSSPGMGQHHLPVSSRQLS